MADIVLGAAVEHVYVLPGPVLGAPIVQQEYSARWTYDPDDLANTSVFTSPVWAGDATGDGDADLLFGKADLRLVPGPLAGELTDDDVAAMLPGATTFSVGGVDADGRSDLLAGDGALSVGVSAEVGAACLNYGPMDGAISTADATFAGTAPFDRLGTSVAIGDGDADGFSDLAIGAPGLDAGGLDAGAALIFAAVL